MKKVLAVVSMGVLAMLWMVGCGDSGNNTSDTVSFAGIKIGTNDTLRQGDTLDIYGTITASMNIKSLDLTVTKDGGDPAMIRPTWDTSAYGQTTLDLHADCNARVKGAPSPQNPHTLHIAVTLENDKVFTETHEFIMEL